MDPSIMKFLEQDEDESMLSKADVKAFTDALNRDIEGDNTSSSQTPTTTDSGGGLSQETNHTPIQLFQSSAMEVNRHGSGSETETMNNPVNPQEPNNQQTAMPTTGQTANAINRPTGKQVPFALLLPVMEPQLDKDKAMQLQGLYVRLRNGNINKEEFVRHMRSLVGDHMLKMAVYKLQQGQVSAKHNIQKPSPVVPPSSIH